MSPCSYSFKKKEETAAVFPFILLPHNCNHYEDDSGWVSG